MIRTVVVTGARGGHGASTIAAVLAARAAASAPTVLRTPDTAGVMALLGRSGERCDDVVQLGARLALASVGVAVPEGTATVVVDGGQLGVAQLVDEDRGVGAGGVCERLVVLRGPCYLALAGLVAADVAYDGIVLLAEPGRALTAADVADVAGHPVVATVEQDPAVARAIDAGLLLTKAANLRSLRPLDRVVQGPRILTGSPLQIELSLRERGDPGNVPCRVPPSRPAVCRAWSRRSGLGCRAEHRSAVAWCR